jgi:signal transduction histidine kinase
MRLLVKTSLFYVVITLAVFIVGSTITFNIFQKQIIWETDRYLGDKYFAVIDGLRAGEPASAYIGQKTTIDTLDYVPAELGRQSAHYNDTLVWHRWLKRMEPNRKLTANIQIADNYLKISTFDVIVESSDIRDGVAKSLTRLFIILAVVIVLGSLLISGLLFKPFYSTLHDISKFNIKKLTPLQLGRTRTREFNKLNVFLEKMTAKVSRDYRNLKEFSENASHELQTPLAIAKGKLELLLQSEDLVAKDVNLIDSAYRAVDHISKLSHALTLLTRIENQEYSDFQEINLSNMINGAIKDFSEILDLKNIKLSTDISENVKITNDQALIRILINNLITNAIRHNVDPGEISINLSKGTLQIENTGKDLKIDPEELFERFKTDKQSGGTMGLGLTIVKKICETSNYQINYSFNSSRHKLTVQFQD